MKKLKIIFSVMLIVLATAMTFAQNDCTLEIGAVDISGLTTGEVVDIPVTMPQVDGVVMGWEFYILFDNTMFTATTTLGDPNYFLQAKTALFPGQWFENINVEVNPGQNQFAANWLDPTFVGVTVPSTEVLFNLRLTYNGGLNAGEQSDMTWNFSNKKADNFQVKGITAVVNGGFAFYNIVPIDGGAFLPGGVGTPGLWTGAADDGDWFNPGNWDDGNVPADGDNIEIPVLGKAMYPTISGGLVTTGSLMVASGASLNVASDGELTTMGLFTNDGDFMIEGDVSGYTGTYIDMAGVAGSGMFYVERTIPCLGTLPGTGTPYGWHYLSAPIDGLTTDDLPEYFVNVWDQPTGMWEQYSTGIPCTPWPTTPLMAGEVWSVNVDMMYPYPECPGSPAANGTTVMFGGMAADLHTGAYSTPLGYGVGANMQWNLVANPYPSGLDLNSIAWGPNTVQGAAFYEGCGGGYGYWTPALGSYSSPVGNGFFIETSAADAFDVDNSNRAHGADFYWKEDITSLLILEASSNGNTDKLYVRFMEGTTPAFDMVGDFHKLFVVADDYPQIYTTIGEEKLAVNALPATSTVPMGFQAETSGTYTINAIETSEFTEIYLEDLVTGETTDLLSDSYTFDYVAGTTADRFVIHFGALGVENSNAYNVNIWSNENNIMVNAPSVNGTIVVYNMMGQEMTRTDIAPGVNVIPMDEVNTYYVVKVLTSDSAITGKVFIK